MTIAEEEAAIADLRCEWEIAARSCVQGFIEPQRAEPFVIDAIVAVIEVAHWTARGSAILKLIEAARKGDAAKPPEASGE